MATLDELQQQLAALSARVDALTTPPDDYYTSKYSGEEIDAGITKTESLPESWPLPIASGGTGADTAQLALANLGARPNRNLFINAIAIGGGGPGAFPVNQRGKTSYTAGTAIDGWKITGNGGQKADLQADGILLTSTAQYGAYWIQTIDPDEIPGMIGKTLTCSCYVGENGGYNPVAVMYRNGEYWQWFLAVENNIASLTFNVPEGTTSLFFQIGADGAGTTVFKAAKLEEGPVQTLGYKDANGKVHIIDTQDYGQELARCQRYGIPVSGGRYVGNNLGNKVIIFIPTPVTLRTKPVIQVSNYGGLVFSSGESRTPTSIEVEAVESNGIKCAVNYSEPVSGALASLGDLIAFISAEL